MGVLAATIELGLMRTNIMSSGSYLLFAERDTVWLLTVHPIGRLRRLLFQDSYELEDMPNQYYSLTYCQQQPMASVCMQWNLWVGAE